MIYHFSNLRELSRAVNNLIAEVGEDAPVGCVRTLSDGSQVLKELMSLDWVVIDEDSGLVEGTEADGDDMELKEGQVNAIRIK